MAEVNQRVVGTPPAGESCGSCKFMISRGTDPNFWYECHINRPDQRVAQGGWPRVELTDWCGEYVVYT